MWKFQIYQLYKNYLLDQIHQVRSIFHNQNVLMVKKV